MKKFKKVLRELLIPIIVGIVFGLAFAVFRSIFVTTSEEAVGAYGGTHTLFNMLLRLAMWLVVMAVGVYIHIIIHEAGRLIAGKLSGYEFVSFRVGSLVIIREEGRLVRKRYALLGTVGQCLMSPPDVADTQYKYPFVFYNLGGGLANILFSILFFIMGLLTWGYISEILFVLALAGCFLGLMNIIPLKLSGMANDGFSIITCRKRIESRRALWIQLKFAALITQGVRPCDMPQEWVENIDTPTDALTGFLPGLRYSYLLDKCEIEHASDYIKSVLENPGKMLELHKSELQCELLFCELVTECRADEIEKLYTEELRKHIKASSTHVSKHRLMYAYELLYVKNEAEANEVLETFEQTCLHTPFLGEVAGERELVELVKRKAG